MKKILWIVVILLLIGVAGYFYVFHKPHRDIAGEKAELHLASSSLVQEYSSDEQSANAKYLDKVVEVEGVVAEQSPGALKLENGVFCSMLKGGGQEVAVGAKVKIKGRVVGYDELFEEVKLDNCQLVQD